MQAVHGQIPILVRTIGPLAELLEIISDPPTGSKNLLIQVFFFSSISYLLFVNEIRIDNQLFDLSMAFADIDRWDSSFSRISIDH